MAKFLVPTCTLAAVLAWSSAGAQNVQSQPDPQSAALRCLTPQRETMAEVEYPLEAWVRVKEGRVVVELEFSTPDAAPAVKIVESSGGGAFDDAVQEHVLRYRLPCLAAGAPPVRLTQEFVFIPNDSRKVVWLQPEDPEARARNAQSRCIVGPKEKSEYPTSARRWNQSGNVLLRLRFTHADQAPEVTPLYDPASARLAASAAEHALGHRLPCLTVGPVETLVLYSYRFEGDPELQFANTSLAAFVKLVTGLKRQTADFDFDTMACPFDVRLQLLQPVLPNEVGEIGAAVPARKPFLDWLTRLALEVPRLQLNHLIGQSMTISVPCGKFKL